MNKASANRVDARSPAAHAPHASPPTGDWLQHAMADLAVRGADAEAPVDLTQSLAAMAALLQEAVRPKDGPGGGAHGRGANGGGVDKTGGKSPAANPASPASVAGAGEAAPSGSLADLTRTPDQVEARLRADGDESLRRPLTELEAGLALRAARAGNANASASDHRGEAAGPGSYDALANLIDSTRRQLVETFESGLAGAANESRGLKDMVQALAKRTEVPPLAALAALEQSIARLLEQLEQARLTAPDAAEAARRLGSDAHGRSMMRELAELRAARDEADNRIHLALNAVQETVGKVADRLARMRADPGAMQPMTAPPPERRPWCDPAKGSVAPGASQAGARGGAGPAPASRNPPGERDAAGVVRSAEIDDFLIEPGAGFPPRPPKPRLPTAPLSAGDQGSGEKDRSRTDGAVSAQRAQPAGMGREPAAADSADASSVFHAYRKPIILGVAALSVALGVCALARIGALKRIEAPDFLKSIGIGAAAPPAPLERRSVVAGGDSGTLVRHREPTPPAPISGLLDPAAFESARENPSLIRNASGKGERTFRTIAGGAPIAPGKITPGAPVAKTPLAR
jgi:hypothetical protein